MNGFKLKLINIASILRSRFILLLALSLAFLPAVAQVKFTTVASSKEIGRSDYVQVEFVVENAQQIDHLIHPSFQDFNIIQGPIQSSGMSIVNGAMSQYKALSFVLQPVRPGKFTIPGATATIDGKSMRSNPVTIEVSANGSGSSNIQPVPQPVWPGDPSDIDREYYLKPGENIADKIRRNLFVKVDVSKTSCYVGEPIVATYKLYSRVQSESRVTKHPSLNGFSVYDMVDPNNDAAYVETVNGKPFTVHVIRKAQLIPLQAGTVDLDPVEVENTVHFLKSTAHQKKSGKDAERDFFDDLFSDDDMRAVPVDQDITLDSKPVAISVKPLPDENKPADYSGAVGHFTLRASIENRNIRARNASTLKITVKGEGNLPVVNAPAVEWPSGIDKYDATTKEDINKAIAPLGGSKTFEFNFIPEDAGNYIIPAVQLSYFDPVSGSYKTAAAQPLNLSVAAATTDKPPRQPLPVLSTTDPEAATGFADFLEEHLEWFFAILILSGLAAYLWVQNRRLKNAQLAAQLAAARAREMAIMEEQASVAPVDPLQVPKELLQHGDYKNFYTALNRALWNAVGNTLNLPASELNKHNIILQLQALGWDKEMTGSLESVLNECEMKLYTPDYSELDIQLILLRAEEIVRALEKRI